MTKRYNEQGEELALSWEQHDQLLKARYKSEQYAVIANARILWDRLDNIVKPNVSAALWNEIEHAAGACFARVEQSDFEDYQAWWEKSYKS